MRQPGGDGSQRRWRSWRINRCADMDMMHAVTQLEAADLYAACMFCRGAVSPSHCNEIRLQCPPCNHAYGCCAEVEHCAGHPQGRSTAHTRRSGTGCRDCTRFGTSGRPPSAAQRCGPHQPARCFSMQNVNSDTFTVEHHSLERARCQPLTIALIRLQVFGLFLGAGSLLHCGRSQGY
jgi:hypothetical protein